MRSWIAMATLLTLVAACDTPAPGPPSPSPSAAWAPPPLRLPSLAAGAACPVTPPVPASPPGDAVVGDGPVHPVAYYFDPGTVLPLRSVDRLPGGGYEVKVRWTGAGYLGPVLLRAGRIDGPGTALSAFSNTGEARDGGHYAVIYNDPSDLPGTTTVSGPGCYAVQVDGTSFSTTIVFRAAAVDSSR
jgi:hypothetical protein